MPALSWMRSVEGAFDWGAALKDTWRHAVEFPVFAAPLYRARRGTLPRPQDLPRYVCLNFFSLVRKRSMRSEATPRPAPPQFLRYGVAGAVGTALHYAMLVALVQFAQAPAVAASTAGAIAGALVNYALNYRWTFASTRTHDKALPRFAAVALAGIAINAIVMAAMLDVAGAHYLVAQVIATGVVLVAGFLANRAWTF